MGLKLKLKYTGSGALSSADKNVASDVSGPTSSQQVGTKRKGAPGTLSDTQASSQEAPQVKRRLKVSLGKSKDAAPPLGQHAAPQPVVKQESKPLPAALGAQLVHPVDFSNAHRPTFPPLQPSMSLDSQTVSQGDEPRKSGVKIRIKHKGNTLSSMGQPPAGFVPPAVQAPTPGFESKAGIKQLGASAASRQGQRLVNQPWTPHLGTPSTVPQPRPRQHDVGNNAFLPKTNKKFAGNAPAHLSMPSKLPAVPSHPPSQLPPLTAQPFTNVLHQPFGSNNAFKSSQNDRAAGAPKKHIVKLKRKTDASVPAPPIKPIMPVNKLAKAPAAPPERAPEQQRAPLHPKPNVTLKGNPRIKIKIGNSMKPSLPRTAPAAAPPLRAPRSAAVQQPTENAASRALRALAKLQDTPSRPPPTRRHAAAPPASAAAKSPQIRIKKPGIKPPLQPSAAPADAGPAKQEEKPAAAPAVVIPVDVEDKDKDMPPVPTKLLRKLFTALIKDDKKTGWFQNPVTEELAPGYFSIIQQPMDYSKIKQKLKNYRTFGEMQTDVRLMFRNATTYNPAGSAVHNKALELLSKSEDKFTEARTLWLDEVRDAKGDAPPQAAAAPAAAPSASAADSGAKTREPGEVVASRAKREPPPPPAPTVLPPRRVTYAEDTYVPRPRGRPARKNNVSVSRAGVHRIHTTGIQRTTTINARASFMQRPHAKHAVWGCLINGSSAEAGLWWAHHRPKISHAYQSREIELETCARKLAFFGSRLRGTARKELVRRAAATVLRRRVGPPEAPVPVPTAVQRPPPAPTSRPASPAPAAAAAAAAAAPAAAHAPAVSGAAAPYFMAGAYAQQQPAVSQAAAAYAAQAAAAQHSAYAAQTALHAAAARPAGLAAPVQYANQPGVAGHGVVNTAGGVSAAPTAYHFQAAQKAASGVQALHAGHTHHAPQAQQHPYAHNVAHSAAPVAAVAASAPVQSRSAPDSPDVVDLRGAPDNGQSRPATSVAPSSNPPAVAVSLQ